MPSAGSATRGRPVAIVPRKAQTNAIRLGLVARTLQLEGVFRIPAGQIALKRIADAAKQEAAPYPQNVQ